MAPNNSSTAVGTRARTARANRRDWANLTAGPAGLIAEQVLADDVAGYLRFRAVCRAWRRCTETPHAHDGLMDSRFHPRRWIMLPEVFAAQVDRRDFLNVSTGERICVDLHELRDQLVIGHTSGGLLVMLCRNGTGDMHLLNPLTHQLTALPNAASLLKSQDNSTGLSRLDKLQVLSAGLADSTTVALHLDDREIELAISKPGDERWNCRTRPQHGPYGDMDSIVSTLSFANRFYYITRNGIKVVDATAADAGQQPQLAVVVEEGGGARRNYLVDNDGELVRVRLKPGRKMPTYEAHRVDVDRGRMVPIYDLRGRAVFVCDGRLVSVQAGLSSSIKADTVYICSSYDKKPSISAYHLQNGMTALDLRVHRGSIVDYLSRYVCRSEDTVVPAPLQPYCSVRAATATAGPRKRKANSMVIGNEWVN